MRPLPPCGGGDFGQWEKGQGIRQGVLLPDGFGSVSECKAFASKYRSERGLCAGIRHWNGFGQSPQVPETGRTLGKGGELSSKGAHPFGKKGLGSGRGSLRRRKAEALDGKGFL